jgi:hypothetical protein
MRVGILVSGAPKPHHPSGWRSANNQAEADGWICPTATERLGLMAIEGHLTLSAHEPGFIG